MLLTVECIAASRKCCNNREKRKKERAESQTIKNTDAREKRYEYFMYIYFAHFRNPISPVKCLISLHMNPNMMDKR